MSWTFLAADDDVALADELIGMSGAHDDTAGAGWFCRKLWRSPCPFGPLSCTRPLALRVPYIVSLGRDTAGELYAVSLNGGVWRLR